MSTNGKIMALLERQFPDQEAILWAVDIADNSGPRFTEDWLNTAAENLSCVSETVWQASDDSEGPNGETKLSQADAERLKRTLELLLNEEQRLRSLRPSRLDNLHESLLDEGRFFSQKAARPDYAHWSRLPKWTAAETVALLLDKDPHSVNARSLKPFRKSPFAKNFRRLLSIVNRAIELGEIPKGIERDKLKALCSRMTIDFPSTFENELLLPEGGEGLGGRPAPRDKPTLDRMILVMAVKHYGYDPHVLKNGRALKSILADLAAVGLEISPSSVRNNLRDAWNRIKLQPGLKGVFKKPISPAA
ncbi:hypothetical protein [Mesorhizobium sp. M7A.F.Ca.MR.362.00.0.0]|uniref:hypothetical protein n=1 Tax=Mesorhizobium sp. M7A.F.Ca.MR.362.00.0.0 TaxID=2496779 RepID=UPI000FD3CF10|nr:hypothetical protein [Mesorhizobium sp. M7A.F.Ca.MR.362.00.0.0]RUU82729.1 hypothetical protein EOC06_02760 [Mesorhizobium sp. M7A.F.Ca.MR.362.00.0.0]RWN96556.1 MAG: hypothetical protein EOS05_01025 [Mesorhizobium sp.]